MNEKLKVDEMGRLGVSDFRAAAKFPLTIVLDNVRSVHNVGSVFRTADAFRLREVMLCGITAIPPSPEMHKTARRGGGFGGLAALRCDGRRTGRAE